MTSSQAPVRPEDLGSFADISEVALSADGRWVTAVVSVPDPATNRYRRDVVVGAVAGCDGSATGSAGESATPVDTVVPPPGSAAPPDIVTGLSAVDAGAPGATRLPRWSPDGTRLAVVTDSAAGCGVRLADPVTGRSQVLLDEWPDPIEELCWSPDGSRLLFVVREPEDRARWQLPEDRRPPLRLTRLGYREDGIGWLVGRPRQAYLLEVPPIADERQAADRTDAASPETNPAPKKLSVGGFDDAEFAWHPDGDTVFFVSQRQPDADRSPLNDIYLQPLDGDPRRLTDTSLGFGAPRPSPDGMRVACTVVDVIGYPAATHLAVLDPANGSVTNLTAELDRDCDGESVVWLDNARLAAIVAGEGRMGVYRFDVTDQAPSLVLGGDRRITGFDMRAGRLAAVCSDPASPPALIAAALSGSGLPGGDEVLLHAPNAEPARARWFSRPQHAAIDVAPGVGVDSWLARPDTSRWPGRHPVIVWLQGGGSQYGYQWSHEQQLLCSAGYAVLYLNPRGSAGYGTDWMRTVSGAGAAHPGSGWGGDDIADVAAVLRATLAANPDLDAGRVGVMGGSYGGLVTTHLLAQTDLFRAGWAERGPYNLYSDAGTKDEAPWFFGAYLGASHLQDPDSYWRASPLRLVEQITAPLMIVHSEEDRRCSIGQAEELFMALKLLDREVEFVRFPGECHGLTRSGSPVHRLQRLEILLEWFGRWLAPKPAS